MKIKGSLGMKKVPVYAWCDSTVVLAWLSDHPRRWKSFIANRTSEILNGIPSSQWRHVASKNNPADLATRGTSASELANHELWWHGPDFLKEPNLHDRYKATFNRTTLEERKHILVNESAPDDELVNLYSDFTKLKRITAYLLRFKQNCKEPGSRQTGMLTTAELKNALTILIRQSQREIFRNEIATLLSGKPLPAKNKISYLVPFIDDDGIMRVGGRLQNAEISYEQKHPIILNSNHELTKLIIIHYHKKYLHVGRRAISYLLGLKYWILSAQTAIKRCIFKCTTCMRFRGKPFQQQMGANAYQRLTPGVTFCNTGIDFAGPVLIKSWKGRGAQKYKCWIAVFVCLVTKAIHIDLVTELSTQAFIACLRRFVARRGKPTNIYSDNGTNFVGAQRLLSDIFNSLNNKESQEAIAQTLAVEDIQWHFSPPSGPHFGGMWEAGVKYIKHHLRRVLGNASTTFEEMQTVLCQIEACLNSRPLCNKIENDVDPLTPAHFLIMRPMTMVVEEDTSNRKESYLTRWQYLQQLVQQYWKKWTSHNYNNVQNGLKNQKI